PLHNDVGDAAGPRGGRQQELALLEDAGPQLLHAHRVDQPLHAGAQLVVAVAVVVERRSTASSVGSSSSRGVNSSRACAGWGLAPSPPATNTRKPGSTEPSSRGRITATTPTSLNIAWPQSVA